MSNEEKKWNYELILDRIRDVRLREENVSLSRALLLSLAIVLLLTVLLFAAEALFQFGTGIRTLIFFLIVSAIGGSFAALAVPPLMKRFNLRARKSYDTVALQIGHFFPDLKDRLLNAIQVYREQMQDNPPGYSKSLMDASFSEVAERFSSVDLAPVVDRNPARKAGKATLFAITFAAIAFAAFPSSMYNAAGRVMQFGTDFTPPPPFEFIIEPGSIEAVKGQSMVLRASTSSPFDPEVTLYIQEEGQDGFDKAPVAKDSAGEYIYEMDAIRTSISYYAEALGYNSKEHSITVVDRPFVRNMRLKLSFPKYTGLPERYLDDNVGDVTALKGTRIRYELTLNKEVSKASIVYNDSAVVPIKSEGTNAQAEVRLLSNSNYHFDLIDDAGIRSMNPISYAMTVVPDMIPSIEIIEPEASTELDERMRVPIISQISDDFGFSKIVLHYRLAASRYELPQENYTAIRIPLPVYSKRKQIVEAEVPYIWNLAGLNLVPEDVVNYYIEVFDNDGVSGPKSARSQIYTLRLPSMEEIYARADKTQNKAIEDLQETLKNAEEVQKSLDDLQREMKQNNTKKLDWQQKKKLEEAIKRHQELMKDVSKVKEDLAQLNQDMEKQDAISEETLEKYQELQELMEEVESPELQEMMRKMNEQMQQITPEQMQQAMEKFEFNEENFRNSVERTIELLKRLQIEQKVDEVTKRAEELADKQEDLAERTENADSKNQEQLDKLAEEQRQLQKEMEAMQKEMNKLQEMMQQFPKDMPLSEMSEAQSEMNLQQMQQQMSESASQCQGGNCKNASKGQKKSAKQMRKVQKKMSQVKKKMNEDQKRMVQNALKKALENLIALSKKQERLKNETSKLPPNSQQFRNKMGEQMQVMEQLNKTANQLMELSKKSFNVSPEMVRHMGEAMKHMKKSMENMEKRDSKQTGKQQGGAMMELNESAKEIAKGMQSQGGSSGGSMMQQLQQMGQRQKGINAEMPDPTGQMSQQQMAQMQRLMGQQRAVQKSLQQLNEEAKQSSDGKRLLGDLDKIADEMQEVIRDMQDNNVSPETRQRQERILSRLLDASRSMNERDWEKKRRSRTGEDLARRSPSEIDPNAIDPKSGLKYELRRAMEEGYSRDYEELIRAYFDALEKNAPSLQE
jgi:uncharacterized protein DUF4175